MLVVTPAALWCLINCRIFCYYYYNYYYYYYYYYYSLYGMLELREMKLCMSSFSVNRKQTTRVIF